MGCEKSKLTTRRADFAIAPVRGAKIAVKGFGKMMLSCKTARRLTQTLAH